MTIKQRTASTDETANIVIVEDKSETAELYAAWLREQYNVQIATSGEQALDVVDDRTDIVLLDRRMPKLSGDEVLRKLRQRDYDCVVTMVTGVKPDFDVVDMGFDDYITKPVERRELYELVESLQVRSTFPEKSQEVFALASKKALLESERDDPELAESPEYRQLVTRLRTAQTELQQMLETSTGGNDSAWAFRTIEDASG